MNALEILRMNQVPADRAMYLISNILKMSSRSFQEWKSNQIGGTLIELESATASLFQTMFDPENSQGQLAPSSFLNEKRGISDEQKQIGNTKDERENQGSFGGLGQVPANTKDAVPDYNGIKLDQPGEKAFTSQVNWRPVDYRKLRIDPDLEVDDSKYTSTVQSERHYNIKLGLLACAIVLIAIIFLDIQKK